MLCKMRFYEALLINFGILHLQTCRIKYLFVYKFLKKESQIFLIQILYRFHEQKWLRHERSNKLIMRQTDWFKASCAVYFLHELGVLCF